MPRGLGDIPDLRLEVIQKLVTNWMTSPNLALQNLFPVSASPSRTIKWESMEGGRGLTPFKPPGAPTPESYPLGVAQHSAEAAFWGEKMYFDEEFLNNLRKEGTEVQYLTTQQRLARELNAIVNRANRRKEFMFAKMLADGSFSYTERTGTKISVDYGVPSANQVSLTADYKWSTGTSADITGDVIDAKKAVQEACNGNANYLFVNSAVFKYMAKDSSIQTLLQKSAFGNGDLFAGAKNSIVGANPAVMASLLGIDNIVVYDERYEVRAYLTGAVTADSTTAISVDDPSDFEAGETLRFVDVSAGTYEDETIASVDAEAGTVTVSTAPSTSYKAGEDYVLMRKYFIPSTKAIFVATTVDGMPTAEYKQAPFGNMRNYGLVADRWETKDPEGIYIRVQDKGLPVLYQRDAVYQLTVA